MKKLLVVIVVVGNLVCIDFRSSVLGLYCGVGILSSVFFLNFFSSDSIVSGDLLMYVELEFFAEYVSSNWSVLFYVFMC